MNNVRYAVIIGMLVLGWSTAAWIRSGYSRDSIQSPPRTPETIPVSFLGYTGKDIDPDPQLLGYLQSESQVDRTYRRPTGEDVTVHAVWTSDYIKLHFPEQCYRESGWTETKREQVNLQLPGGATVPTTLLAFEQGGQRIEVLYWLQMGDRIILNRADHRLAYQSLCWGQKEWPPLVKVMLTAPAANPAATQEQLQQMATGIYKWINGIDPPLSQ